MTEHRRGQAADRRFARQGYVTQIGKEDQERGRRLWALLMNEPFWCDACGSSHPLREHRDCRAR